MTLLKITQVWWCCAVLLLVSTPSLYGQYIKVDEADSQYVGKPLVKNDPAYADFNSKQIALIMMSAPRGATIYFPAGDYHFNHNVGIVETTGDASTGNFLLDHVVVTNVDIGENHTGGILARRFFEVAVYR